MLAADPLLAQIPLIVSPGLRPPQAVTLPFNFNRLPSSLPPQNVSEATLDQISHESKRFIEHLDKRREERKENYQSWKEKVDKEEIEEKRRIAPGYLDTNYKLLQPSRRQASIDHEINSSENTTNNNSIEVNELDRVFGDVSLK